MTPQNESAIRKCVFNSPLFAEFKRATGRLVGRSLENELGILNPWSVGDGVERFDSASDGGDGLSELAVPPDG